MANYEVTIIEASKELTAKERIQLKDTTDSVKLDTVIDKGAIEIKPEFFAELLVHNEKAEDKEYPVYIIVSDDGTKYTTGSQSFWSSFKNIYNEMKDETEAWGIKVYGMPSKNRQGKHFITCSLI